VKRLQFAGRLLAIGTIAIVLAIAAGHLISYLFG
jgi:hypothetical protein